MEDILLTKNILFKSIVILNCNGLDRRSVLSLSFPYFQHHIPYAKLFFLFPVMFANFKHLLKLCFQLFTCIKETDVMHTESFPS